MGTRSFQELASRDVWALARRQHGVVTRAQLLDAGFNPEAIKHRCAKGRLHQVHRGVYAVGRAELGRHGRWMAAVLACGPWAAGSHDTAAAVYGIAQGDTGKLHVSVPVSVARRRHGIIVHRRAAFEVTTHHGIPVTTPVCTLIDLAACWPTRRLEAAINEADKLGLVDVEELRDAAGSHPWRRGAPALRRLLDRSTFVLTESELERRFLPIARRSGLSRPETGVRVNGFKVDFLWRDLGLIVETDGLRYHRTALQQARDRARDQAHTAAGLTPLRFTHAQIAFEPRHVEATLRAVARRLAG